MAQFSPVVLLMMLGSIAFQVFAIYMIPATKGLTQPVQTAIWAISFLCGVGLMARMSYSGVNLTLIVPILAATVPLGAIAIGVLLYGEPASMAKIATLLAACGLIVVANII